MYSLATFAQYAAITLLVISSLLCLYAAAIALTSKEKK